MEPKRNVEVLVLNEGHSLEVWAGAEQVEKIRNTEGVHMAFVDSGSGTKYTVYPDARYDRNSLVTVLEETLKG